MRRTDPIIIGGGPAGAAAAIALARYGATPLVLEKQIETGDAICGGFLSWATLQQITNLGIDPARLDGHNVTHLTLHTPHSARSIALPAPALGVSRRRLDNILLDHAAKSGANIRRGATVRHVEATHLSLTDGENIDWTSLFLSSGKHDVRGVARAVPTINDPELGLRIRLPVTGRAQALLNGQIELHLFDKGYLGLVLQEDGALNACMAVRKSRLTKAGGNPMALFAQVTDASPALADRLGELTAGCMIDAIGNVPYGWRAHNSQAGLYRLGDQAAVIPSLAGEGIGIALASARYAARIWRDHGTQGAQMFQREFSRAAARPFKIADFVKTFSTGAPLGNALTVQLAGVPGAAALVARLTRIAHVHP